MNGTRTWTAVIVAAVVVVALVGCGGGGGVARLSSTTTGTVRSEADHSLETINTAQAVAAPKPQAPLEASAAGLAELGTIETAGPLTDAQLRLRLDNFTRLANASPKDVAAQTGLALSLAGIGVVNGARVLGAQLPADYYVPVAPSAVATQGVKAGEASTKAMELALQPTLMMRGGGGTKASAQVGQVKPQALVPGQTFTTQELQSVLADLVLPSVKSAIDRLQYIVDSSTDGTILLDYTSGTNDYHVYRQDLRSAATALRVVYAMGLFANAYNWDWGTFDWELDPAQRDANHNGVLTVGEYLPASPFGTLLSDGATNMSTALAMLRTAVADAGEVLGAIPSDTSSPLNKATDGQLPADLQHYRDELSSASSILAAQVPMSIEYAYFNEDTYQFYGHNTISVPFNLPSFFSTPEPDLKALMPSGYLVPDALWDMPYNVVMNPGATAGTMGLSVTENYAEVWWHFPGNDGNLEQNEPAQIDLPGRQVTFDGGSYTITLNYSADCRSVSGSTAGSVGVNTFTTTSFGSTSTDKPQMVMRLGDAPDKTLHGLLPSPTQIWNNVFLATPAPVILIYSYGKLKLDASDPYYRSIWTP